MCGRAVRGQEEHAFGHVIKTADVREARSAECRRDEVENGSATRRPFVACCGKDARRLVKYQPLRRARRRDFRSVHRDAIVHGIDRLTHCRDLSIHANATGSHELVGFTTRPYAGTSQGSLDSHRPTRHGSGAGRSATASSSARGSSPQVPERKQLEKSRRRPVQQRTSECVGLPHHVHQPALEQRFEMDPADTPRISSTSARVIGWR